MIPLDQSSTDGEAADIKSQATPRTLTNVNTLHVLLRLPDLGVCGNPWNTRSERWLGYTRIEQTLHVVSDPDRTHVANLLYDHLVTTTKAHT